MKIRKRYILLIILSILPFYKIIHFDDFCINDVDYLLIAFLSIIVLVTFLAIVFFNLYQISIHRELFNLRPIIIFVVFSITLYFGLKYPDFTFFKNIKQQFSHSIDLNSSAKIILYDDATFIFKTKLSTEVCAKYGSYLYKNDSLFLKLNHKAENANSLDTIYFFDKTQKKLLPKSINLPVFGLN
jgi:hypothetical protein